MKAALFAALLMVSLAFPFSIDYYSSAVSVQPDGGLLVNETMVFTLEEQYNEGYRSIRPVDYGTLNDLVVHSVKVNGRPVSYYTQENGGSSGMTLQRSASSITEPTGPCQHPFSNPP